MRERDEGNMVCLTSNMHGSAEVTEPIVAHKTYGANLNQFRILSSSCPFSSHFHAMSLISYMSLIPEGNMSLLINFYAFICHKMAIM